MSITYSEFLETKKISIPLQGVEVSLSELNSSLFPFQKVLVQWALRKGRSALFADCGLGKTFMQLEWAHAICEHTNRDVLILAPLAVASQTVSEGEKLRIRVHICRSQADVKPGINITNYEMLSHFDPGHFAGVVLDESSILKSYMGKTKRALIDAFAQTAYRLCCTATPAPNDHMEIGNHAEFLGIMPSTEMLMRWFINDTMQNGHYRLKGHAEKDFWQWVASWAISVKKPSDLGFSDDGFTLPELQIKHHYVATDVTVSVEEGQLFRAPTMSATNLHREMRLTVADRAQAVGQIILKDWLCGKKNTQTIDELKKKQNLDTKLDETSKATEKITKSDWNINENTNPIIGIELSNYDESMQKNEMHNVEIDMHKMKNIEKKNAQKYERSMQPTPQKNENKDLNPTTDLTLKNTTNSLLNKTVNVQSAAILKHTKINGELFDLLSIIATQAKELEGYSAQVATSESESFSTIHHGFAKLLTISKDALNKFEPWAIWCNTNYEQEALEQIFGDWAFSVYGSLSSAEKESRILKWLKGERPILITKPSICGYGLNFQHCHRTAFVGLSYSFEDFYQAVRRLYRFGQKDPVECVIVAAETESPLVTSLERKIQAHMKMSEAMNINAISTQDNLELTRHESFTVERNTDYELYHGDCVTVARTLPSDSIHFSVFSPPFSNLYIYSDAAEDMGNAANDDEFFKHFDFLIPELLRITKPGRLCAVHCKQLVSYKNRDGAAGLRDFRGEIIRHFSAGGWQYHSEVCIWKDPVIEMQRTKAHGLLYKQLRADSTFSRQGLAEYLLIFRKWPQSEEQEGLITPVSHTRENFDLDTWQRYASPVWFDIRQTNVLNVEQARESQDEKHICPLQLDVIERALQLWSNPGETVFSPFTGIGSEGFMSLKMSRKFVGVELKESYFQVAQRNLEKVLREKTQATLWDEVAG